MKKKMLTKAFNTWKWSKTDCQRVKQELKIFVQRIKLKPEFRVNANFKCKSSSYLNIYQ